MTVIGDRTRRTDGTVKVTGKAVFSVDYAETGMLHAKLLRSPVPAGRILKLDTSAAIAMPGVLGVFTAADAPDVNAGWLLKDQRLFAGEVVRYEGEAIAGVVAETAAQARAAVAAIDLEIEETEVVADVEAALDDGAPLVHPDWESYQPNGPADHPRQGNVAAEMVADTTPEAVAAAFKRAHVVVEDEYRSLRQYQACLEPKNALVRYEDGRFIVHTSSQYPFNVRDRVAQFMNVRPSQVRVLGHHIGGGFGARLDASPEPFAALMAKKTGRPVKLVYDRVEDLITCPSRENAVVRVKTALAEDGEILARDVEVLMDNGAYSAEMPWLASLPMHVFGQVYRATPVRIVSKLVYTNTAPTGAFRGVGGVYLYFAQERHMDHCARVLGLDRLAIRRRNLIAEGAKTLTEQVLDQAEILGEAFDKLEEMAPWEEANAWKEQAPEGKRRGVGIAAVTWMTNPMPGSVMLKLNQDGTVGLITSANDNGSGALTMGVTQVVAAELGIDVNDVVATMPDTDATGYDSGSQGSRTVHIVGRAVREAAAEVREKVLSMAATLLEAAKEDLVLEDGKVSVRGVPGAAVSLGDVAVAATWTVGPIQGTGSYTTPALDFNPGCASGLLFPVFPTPTYHVHLAQVEVDEVTGNVDVDRYVVVQEVGKVINPDGVRGQIQGGVAQGLGYALYETMDMEDGRYQQRTLETYRLPLAVDVPDVEFSLLEHPDAQGPYGAKGVAEPPVVPVPAAVGNAVSDAIGVELTRTPLRPDDVLAAILGS